MAKIKAAHVSDRQEKQRLAAMVLERTGELQRELVNDREVFGTLEKGSAQAPAVRARWSSCGW